MMTSNLLCVHCGSPIADGVDLCRVCGAPSPPPLTDGDDLPSTPDWDEVFDRLKALGPRYRVLRRLGVGGMAGVFLAEEPRLERLVAIKVMLPALMADARFVLRFEREARTMARLAHPNIVTVFDIDEKAGLHYFSMGYVPGRSLAHVLALNISPLPFDLVFHWIAQTGNAIAYAHRHGIIHRDLKPSNILLDVDGNAHVTDFGIAKVAEQSKLTSSGVIVGTPLYMSPEQCAGTIATVASDQYALGIVAFELIAGMPPFRGVPIALLNAHLNAPPPDLPDLRPDCPDHVAEAVHRMLEKDPAKRYADVGQALAAFNARTAGERGRTREMLRAVAMPKTLRIVPESIAFHALGQSCGVTANLLEWNGIDSGQVDAAWETGDPTIAEVRLAGVVSSVGNGSTRVTARLKDLVAFVDVTVEQEPAALEVEPREIVFSSLGDGMAPSWKVSDANGHDVPIRLTWETDDPDVATVEPSGRIVATGNGTATVVCRAGWLEAFVKVGVQQVPARIAFVSESIVLSRIGETSILPLRILDAGGSEVPGALPALASSAPGVVEVIRGGQIRAVRDGTAEIRATLGSLEAVVHAAVRRHAHRMVLRPTQLLLSSIGEQARIDVDLLDEDGHPVSADLAWESSEPEIARVSDNGTVVAMADGECIVSIRAGHVNSSMAVRVWQEPVSITTMPAELEFGAVGDSERLTIVATDALGVPMRARPRFRVGDPSVARVNDEGAVSAVREGRTAVTVTMRSRSCTVAVRVQPRPRAIRLGTDTLEFNTLGKEAKVTAEVLDARGVAIHRAGVLWSSTDNSVARVDESGVVRAVGRGVATIVAQCEEIETRLRVYVEQSVGQVKVRPDFVQLSALGASANLRADILDTFGQPTALPVHWKSTDPEVARVGSDGLVTAVGNGSTRVVATCGAVEGSVVVAVDQKPVRIVVTPDVLSFQAAGETRGIRAELLDSNDHPVDGLLKWTSSDNSVVLADGKGGVKAVSDGTATVVVRHGSLRGSVAVEVRRAPVRIRTPEDTIQLERPGVSRRLVADLIDAAGQPIEGAVEWKSTNPDVAAATGAGSVLAVSPGSAMLLASWGELRSIVNVTVHFPKPTVRPPDVGSAGTPPPDELGIGAGALFRMRSQWSGRARRNAIGAAVVLTATIISVSLWAGLRSGGSGPAETAAGDVANAVDDSAALAANPPAPVPPPISPADSLQAGAQRTPTRRTAAEPVGADPIANPDLARQQIMAKVDTVMRALGTGSSQALERAKSAYLDEAESDLRGLLAIGYQPTAWPLRTYRISATSAEVTVDVTVRSSPPQPPRTRTLVFDRRTGPWRLRSFK